MSQEASTQRRDDSAWPRGATPFSLVLGAIAVLVGLAAAGDEDPPLVPVLVLLLGVAIGAGVIVVGIRRWLAGGQVSCVLALISGGTAVVGIVLAITTDSATGPALLAGLVAGLMFANVWAIRTARKRRRTPAS